MNAHPHTRLQDSIALYNNIRNWMDYRALQRMSDRAYQLAATSFGHLSDAEIFAPRGGPLFPRGLVYGAFGAVLSWSFTTIAVAAKNVMTSVPDYLVIESAFTAVQWAIVGPLTALAFAGAARKEHAAV